MGLEQLGRRLSFRPSVVNLMAVGASLAWVAVVGAAVAQMTWQVDPTYMELRAVVGSRSTSEPARRMNVVEDVLYEVVAETDEVMEPVAATAVPEAEPVTEQVEPTVEILEVIEHAPGAAVAHDGLMFDGRPLRKVRTIRMLVTAYSPDERSCGKWADGITASGYSVWTNGMKLVAADTKVLPFHSIITVPGYNDGRPVPVLDRGGAIKGNRLDVLMPTHEIALQWGVKRLDVDVWEYAD